MRIERILTRLAAMMIKVKRYNIARKGIPKLSAACTVREHAGSVTPTIGAVKAGWPKTARRCFIIGLFGLPYRMANPSVTIVDYGVGNLFNVQRALRSVGAETIISKDPHEIERAERILLPGVGAFAAGMDGLREHGLIDAVRAAAKRGTVPFLGICLGMQLLMDSSEENGDWQGLGLIPGRVRRFSAPHAEEHFKIPQIGWNTIEKCPGQEVLWENSVLRSVDSKSFVYFVHSYFVDPQERMDVVAETNYGRDRFCSVIKRGSITGCQFHPERSGDAGLSILRCFIEQRI